MSIAKLTKIAPDTAASPAVATGRRVLETEAAALQKLAAFLSDSFAEAADMIAKAEGRVIVTGMGKSGHVGRKVAATLASTGTPAFYVHPAEASHGDMGMIVRGDVVLAISNSGESRELSDIITYTRRFAIPLIAVTAVPASTLGQKADVALLLPSCAEACPNGLAPTTSTTMTMALGDALAIALLEKKGFTAKDYKVFHPGGKLGQQLLRVEEIMHTGARVPVAAPSTPMAEAVRIISEKGLGCVCIVNDDGRLEGIITDGDIRRHLSADITRKTAGEIMTRAPTTVRVGMLAAEAVALMNDVRGGGRKITSLVVVDEQDAPAGLLHIHDCLKAGLA